MIEKIVEKILYFNGYVAGTCFSPLLIRGEPTLEKIGYCMEIFYRLVGLKINEPEVSKENNEAGVKTKGDCWLYKISKPPYEVCEALFGFDRGLVRGLGGKSYEHTLTKSLARGDDFCEFCTRRIK